ncbi:homolog of yeast autophagy 18 (ATG18) H [Hibiscus trionum]|uniref:Homolog of yeast autophagy 18 (ATG18) H n=1 Tax=Hibiscus trionum TaxID=183268 RepID=A0A9W7GVM0_HIBTR|nr:homolog of yeast autophagy 18 (ATG18) H [Hibiscus trionum]GMI65304.1 homolog of yeast autophagy 18 (ATG18) H [Hibiscus trionum]
MKSNANIGNNKGSNIGNNNRFLPNSLRFISSCLKTASSGVRSASASVAASIAGGSQEHPKDQVLWASFDRLELGPLSFKRVLLLGYSNGFQVLDVEDASNVSELVSRRDDPATFLQMQPLPEMSEGHEGFRSSHPLLLVVADESKVSGLMLTGRDGFEEPKTENAPLSPTAVRFYSLRSHNYVHVLRFRSTVFMVRCSPRIVAVGLATQIYCFDALTLENKFSVLTYPVPQAGGQGMLGINIGYGPMAVGPRWLAYASNNPLQSNTGRLSPQNLTPSPGVSPSTSPSSGSLMARYAMESSKQLAAGLINLGDMGYKTLSKYYQDFIPDGSGSPMSSNSGRKVGRGALHSAEIDIAGTVVVKDFVSKAVVSQFRAHTSPISALCFDPSGTLLVTASIHGNNINIFRIMPSSTKKGSGTQSYDWSSSHVHLYKLHRGMTSAVIQDICFSAFSQWIAIVSSRGTCHIFVLSPFGGENVLQIRNSHVDGPILSPVVSFPWWSTPSFLRNYQTFSLPAAPPTVTLSVVSRIKNVNSGWLNTVTSAASSAAGRTSFPYGAFSAVFHNSLPNDLQRAQVKDNVLEHLLVYTPSGHVVQHKLLPSFGGEEGESASRIGPGSAIQVQEEGLRVKVEAMQAWDVCRRTDWPEREECLSGMTHGRKEALEMAMDGSDSEDNFAGQKDLSKPQERAHLYLSNAEVQISSGRIPIWQNSKVSFHTTSPVGFNEHTFTADQSGGEIEIERMPAHEVEIRQRDLLPIFEHFHRIQPDWNDRGLAAESYPMSSSHDAKAIFSEVTVISHSKLMSPGSTENSDNGSSRNSYPPSIQSGKDGSGLKGQSSILASHMLNQSSLSKDAGSVSFNQSKMGICHNEDDKSTISPSSLTSDSLSGERNSGGSSDVSNTSSNRSDLSMNMLDEGPVNESPDFEHFFQEEYCKVLPLSPCGEPTDVDSNINPCEREKSEEGDNDDMLGGVFSFSEEG